MLTATRSARLDLKSHASGRRLKAPQNILDADGVRQVFAEAMSGRRDIVRKAFAVTGVAAAVGTSCPGDRAVDRRRREDMTPDRHPTQTRPAPARGPGRRVFPMRPAEAGPLRSLPSLRSEHHAQSS